MDNLKKEKEEQIAKCKLCGEPMPEGEEMFYYHGYSGDCPKPPLPKIIPPISEKIATILFDVCSCKRTTGCLICLGARTELLNLLTQKTD